ncbi:MAG: UDP-N-acetylmuramate: L-alanyl-gamma-D-glutamyl-meso-diaminopimelate ligase [Cellvibrionaceae bacterium]|jgi:UDP-N-acetylmuramate: L-alanyl-gamma-D-glutamyl-meso-diaminopimelate ligase
MGSLAQLAQSKGFKVTGCDAHIYPPMDAQLQQAGIELIQGFDADQVNLHPDLFVIGNVMSRGNPLVERILNDGLPYYSGPEWLHNHLLQDRWVLGVSGTHGKTTTSSMLAWILEYAGMNPGFLIGGVPGNFSVSARLGSGPHFVIEADEYDSAFFDKRSKFVHYHPRTLIINNIEFDHADIFDDLPAIQKQFHHLVRTVPGKGLLITPACSSSVSEVIKLGCWSPRESFALGDKNSDWSAQLHAENCSDFSVSNFYGEVVRIRWQQLGRHNVCNAVAAIAAARHAGVDVQVAAEALACFAGVKRRMEMLAEIAGIKVYDDFAHHPTAIATTLDGLRTQVGNEQIILLIEPRSNTMRDGIHQNQLTQACAAADYVLWYCPQQLSWDITELARTSDVPMKVFDSLAEMIAHTLSLLVRPSHLIVMSNGSFDGIHQKLVNVILKTYPEPIQ